MSWCFGFYTPLILLLLLVLPFFFFIFLVYRKFTKSKTEHKVTRVLVISFFLTFTTHVVFILLSFSLQPILSCRFF